MRCATRRTDAPGSASRMKASSLVHACENPWATVRMAQLCSVIRQLPSGSRSASARYPSSSRMAVSAATCSSKGRWAVFGSAPATRRWRRCSKSSSTWLAPGTAEVPEELGREVAVALRVERLGGRGQLVDVAWAAAPRSLGHFVVMREEPVLFEMGQLQPDGGGGERRARPPRRRRRGGPGASAG